MVTGDLFQHPSTVGLGSHVENFEIIEARKADKDTGY